MPNPEYAGKPPQVIHLGGRPPNYHLLIERCCQNVHVSGALKRLLDYYAETANQWSPALKTISKETRIAANKIYELRAMLADKGLLQYERGRWGNQGYVIIDWPHIKIFAALTGPIKTSQADRRAHKASGYNPYRPPDQADIPSRRLRVKDMPEYKTLKVNNPIPLTKAQADALDVLERLPVAEYEAMFGKPSKYIEVDQGDERREILDGIQEYQRKPNQDVA